MTDNDLMYEEHDDEIVSAGAFIIRTGSIERAEEMLRKSQGLDPEQAQDAVAEAALMLINTAPAELRKSFDAVCSYHRWNYIYEISVTNHRMKDAMDAQKQLDILLRSVH